MGSTPVTLLVERVESTVYGLMQGQKSPYTDDGTLHKKQTSDLIGEQQEVQPLTVEEKIKHFRVGLYVSTPEGDGIIKSLGRASVLVDRFGKEKQYIGDEILQIQESA